MAEKGFGVKEINLIGPSGTPTITSPNNLNLNAVNVAISTNATIGGNLTVSGTVGIAGTLTYEDVTNIDSVGIITAQKDIHVGAGLSVVGVSTLTGAVNSSANITTTLDLNSRYLYVKDIFMEDVSPELRFVDTDNDPDYRIRLNSGLLGIRDITNNVDKLVFNTSGMVATGIVTATTFSGSGASLTNVPAADPTATDVQVAYELLSTSASGAGWRITGNGIINTVNNPDLYLIRGQKYRFINNSGGSHPFRIQSDSSTAYGTGVTNNNASSGNIDFVPRNDAPARLYYNCTNHGGMLGNIYLRGAGGQETNVGVTTFSGGINFSETDSIIHTTSDSSRLRLFGGSTESVSNGGALTLHGVSHSAGNYTDLAAATGGHIQFRVGTSEKVRITSNGDVRVGGGAPATFGSGTTVHETYNASTYTANLVTSGTHQLQMIASQTHGSTSIGTRSNHNLNLCANDSTKVTITTAGQVAIRNGGTTTQSANLIVFGDADNSDVAIFSGGDWARGLKISTAASGNNDALVILDAQNADNGCFSFKTHGDERLRISSDGHVTKPNQPMFAAKGTTDAIVAQSPLPFDNTSGTEYNVGNHYSTSTYKFTCPVNGYYYVTCHVVPTNYSTGGNNVELYVKDNSGNRYFLDRKVKDSSYSTNNFSVGGSRIIYQTSGSTLWVEFNAISGSPTLEGSSHFGIMLMA